MVELHSISYAAFGYIQHSRSWAQQILFLVHGDSDQRLFDFAHNIAIDDLRSDGHITAGVILIPHMAADGHGHGENAQAQ